MPESERSDENGMVILSRVDACAPPYPTLYTGSGDVKQKRRARRPEGEEWSEAGIRNLRQQVKYALRFFVVETALHQNPKHLSLSPPSRSAATASAQAGQSNNTKETTKKNTEKTKCKRKVCRFLWAVNYSSQPNIFQTVLWNLLMFYKYIGISFVKGERPCR